MGGRLVVLVTGFLGIMSVCPGLMGLMSKTASAFGVSASMWLEIFLSTIIRKIDCFSSSPFSARSLLCLTSSSSASGDNDAICWSACAFFSSGNPATCSRSCSRISSCSSGESGIELKRRRVYRSYV